MRGLAGKVAIVTGASRGIGLAIAHRLAAADARVILVARDDAALRRAADDLPGQTACVAGNAASAETAERAVHVACDRFGGLDLLLNIAGWYPTARVEETSDADFRETIDSNLGATFAMCRAALPALRERKGAIVNMSSMAARFPTPGLAAYAASKAGVEAFTRCLAIEAAPDVRVNAVSAGPTATDAVRDLMATDRTGAVAAVTAGLPLGRLAEPDEIAAAFLYLASPAASVVTGQVLHANCGGYMA